MNNEKCKQGTHKDKVQQNRQKYQIYYFNNKFKKFKKSSLFFITVYNYTILQINLTIYKYINKL